MRAWPFACAQLNLSTLAEFGIPHLGNDAAPSGLGLPASVNFIKTVHHRYAHRLTEYGQSLTETLSSKDAARVCQVDN